MIAIKKAETVISPVWSNNKLQGGFREQREYKIQYGILYNGESENNWGNNKGNISKEKEKQLEKNGNVTKAHDQDVNNIYIVIIM